MVPLGWCHSHPGYKPFQAQTDDWTHTFYYTTTSTHVTRPCVLIHMHTHHHLFTSLQSAGQTVHHLQGAVPSSWAQHMPASFCHIGSITPTHHHHLSRQVMAFHISQCSHTASSAHPTHTHSSQPHHSTFHSHSQFGFTPFSIQAPSFLHFFFPFFNPFICPQFLFRPQQHFHSNPSFTTHHSFAHSGAPRAITTTHIFGPPHKGGAHHLGILFPQPFQQGNSFKGQVPGKAIARQFKGTPRHFGPPTDSLFVQQQHFGPSHVISIPHSFTNRAGHLQFTGHNFPQTSNTFPFIFSIGPRAHPNSLGNWAPLGRFPQTQHTVPRKNFFPHNTKGGKAQNSGPLGFGQAKLGHIQRPPRDKKQGFRAPQGCTKTTDKGQHSFKSFSSQAAIFLASAGPHLAHWGRVLGLPTTQGSFSSAVLIHFPGRGSTIIFPPSFPPQKVFANKPLSNNF